MPFNNVTLNPGAAFSAPLNPTATPPTHQIAVAGRQATYTSNNGAQLLIDLDTDADMWTYASAFSTAEADPVKIGMAACHYLGTIPSEAPHTPGTVYDAYKTNRTAMYSGVPVSASLGAFFVAGPDQAALCRERSFMLHILLAEKGIPTRIAFGRPAPGGIQTSHFWVEFDSTRAALFSSVTRIWDPAKNKVLFSAAAINQHITEYGGDRQFLVLASPVAMDPNLP